jgi:hypothetical protein
MYVQGNAKFVSPVRRIVVHEYYNSQTFDYDIALLQLSVAWPETLKQLIQPICIPPTGQKLHSGEKCWVTGWGRKHEAGVCLNNGCTLPLPMMATYVDVVLSCTFQRGFVYVLTLEPPKNSGFIPVL